MSRIKAYKGMKISKKLIKAVEKEAKAIRKHATKEEIANLKIKDLDGDRFDGCVYGLLTGDCRSERAKDLISSCAPFTVRLLNHGNGSNPAIPRSEEARAEVIGSEEIDPSLICEVPERNFGLIYCFSPIEMALWKSKETGVKIINIIKGKSETFDI